MSRKRILILASAFLMALLLAAGGAASFGPPPGGGAQSPFLIPVAEMVTVDCAKLDITVELGGGFDEITCSGRHKGYGGESPQIARSRIDAVGPLMDMVLFHDHAGSNTYMERQTPRDLIENAVDYDIPGSWGKAAESNDFAIATFFANFGSHKVPCFAFARYAGHVSRSTGYSNRVFGVYCEKIPDTEPLAAARIDEVTSKIKAKFF
jgi:hypothetical protein